MEEQNKKSALLPVLLSNIILIIILGLIFYVLNDKGYLSFTVTSKTNNDIVNSVTDDNSSNDITSVISDDNTTNSSVTNDISTSNGNMTTEEVFAFWNKIKGNWANVKYTDDFCAGQSVGINTFVTFAKFNSDGITKWSILSFEKVDDNNYKINLVSPVNLNNEMDGDIKAHYLTISVDISNLNNKKLIVDRNGGKVEYEYVGENKLRFDESTNYQYVDGGFTQDYYCNWYKENH